MTNSAELKEMSATELQKMLETERKKHYLLKVGVRTGHLKNSHDAKESQKNVARLLTELNRRQKSLAADKKISTNNSLS